MGEFNGADEREFMARAIDLAERARKRGDDPFGAVLVHDGQIVMEAMNAVTRTDDIRRHPELTLAMRAIKAYEPAERREMAMFTSAEPCPMCSGGIRYAAFDRVVYSVSHRDLAAEIRGEEPRPVGAGAILSGVTTVEGPLLHDRGYRVLSEYYATESE